MFFGKLKKRKAAEQIFGFVGTDSPREFQQAQWNISGSQRREGHGVDGEPMPGNVGQINADAQQGRANQKFRVQYN